MLKKELIGIKVRVLKSKNKTNKDVEGEIIDETMNTLKIRTNKGEKIMLKDQNVFGIMKEGKMIEVEGKLLRKKPEERVKT